MTNPETATAQARSERGFTLVELMVVVAIIALLAAIIIPNYVHARAQAAVSQSEANMKQISTALELYYSDKQTYPPGSAAVTPDLFGGAGNQYLASTPTNAQGHAEYSYTFATTPTGAPTYTLTDPGAYDKTTMTSIPQAPEVGGVCSTCTHLLLTPQAGIYGN